MCGIAGWFGEVRDQRYAEQDIKNMMQAIAHRGPDGKGFKVMGNTVFGHTRLSIIDLADGAQPMSSISGDVTITYNGEIYNYRELRNNLIKQGFTFQSNSDTEVILNLYLHKGDSGFELLRGMYAFALWDERRQMGLLARDPIGIKPLFYSQTRSGDLIFASEAKAIVAKNQSQAKLDEQSLHLFLNLRYVSHDRSLFANVKQLLPGSILTWQPDHPPKCSRFSYHTTDQTNLEILSGLEDATTSQLVADVEVGTYLSGGIDSAMITALAKIRSNQGIRTFTVDAGDDPFEARNATRTAELLGVENIQGHMDESISESLTKLIWHLEAPKINSYQVNQVAKHASKYVKVVLSGLGGDELFFGYNTHRLMHHFVTAQRWFGKKLISISGNVSNYMLEILDKRMWTEPLRASMMLANSGDWACVYALLRNAWDSPEMRRSIYGPRMLDAELPNAFENVRHEWPACDDPLDAFRKFEWKEKMVNDLLWQEDRCSMAEGLEVRVPFLDLEYSSKWLNVSPAELMPGGRQKQMFKQAMTEFLPKEIISRSKSGFQVDAVSFFRDFLSTLAERYLNENVVRENGIFNPQFIKQVQAYKPSKGLRWHYFMLYMMIGTHIWLELFEASGEKAAMGEN